MEIKLIPVTENTVEVLTSITVVVNGLLIVKKVVRVVSVTKVETTVEIVVTGFVIVITEIGVGRMTTEVISVVVVKMCCVVKVTAAMYVVEIGRAILNSVVWKVNVVMV